MLGGNSRGVQWLGLHASTAGGTGSIPGWGTKVPHAAWHGQKKTSVGKDVEKMQHSQTAGGNIN